MKTLFRSLKWLAIVSTLATITARPSALAHTILNSWAGTTWVPKRCGTSLRVSTPPDPHGAAGPSGILQTVNLDVAYFTKAGTPLWGPVDLGNFWSGVGNAGDLDAMCNTINSDPKVIYDASSGRFYVIMQENLTTPPFRSFLNLAVSKTSNPTGSGADQWFFFHIDMTETAAGVDYGGDYPGLGVDGQAVYVTYNMVKLPITRGFGIKLNTQIIVLKKADINQGVLTLKQIFTAPLIAETLVPASVIGAGSPGNKAFFAQMGLPTAIALWTLADPLGSATLLPPVPLPVLPSGDFPGPGAPQNRTSTRLETLGEIGQAQGNAFWRNGSVWFCYTGGVLFDERTKVYYYRIDTDPIPTVGESGSIDGGDGVWTFQPSIGGNACGDVCMVYCESSAAEFPRIMCAVRPRGASGFDAPFEVKGSTSFYVSSCGQEACWGDYASVSADPTDGTFWITHEWARSSNTDDWGTWWAQIAVMPPPARSLFVSSQSCLFHTGAKDCTGIPAAGPYATVRDGVNNAFCGDILNIRVGSYNEQLTITKALRLQSYDGAATIGR